MSATTFEPTTVRAGATNAPRVPAVPWAALPVVLAATFMITLDFFIVNVALPSMQADLHAGSGAIEWVVAGYGLTLATGLITGGRLGDRYGRRRMFALGLALFTLASLACGIAPSPGVLVAARFEQGLAAALLAPQVMAIISVAFQGPDRVKALTWYGMVAGIAAAGGQLLGGALVQLDVAGLGWRSVFLINIPVGAAALALTPRFVPESRQEGGAKLDLVGAALITLALVDVVLPLVEGRQHGWPAWTWVCLGAAPVALGAFAIHARRLAARGGAPLLDPAMFREHRFTPGLVANLAYWCGMASFFFVLALYLQPGRGLDALQAGLVFTILATAYLVTSFAAPGLVARHGRRVPAAGGVLLALGHAVTAAVVFDVGTGGSVAALVPGLVLIGLGMGAALTPLNSLVLEHVSPQRAGGAAGTLSTVQQVGNAIGVAVMGVLFFGLGDHGLGHAFAWCEVALTAAGIEIALLSRFLARGTHPAG